MKIQLKVKIGMLIAALFLAAGPREAFAMTIGERLFAPAETLRNAPNLPKSFTPIPCYARTFQKTGSSNRVIAILPFVNWGILDVAVIGGTPSFADLTDGKGLLGTGGGVSFDRFLESIFPELEDAFSGPIPGTNGKFTFAVKAGVGAVWDFTTSEAATLIYGGPQILW